MVSIPVCSCMYCIYPLAQGLLQQNMALIELTRTSKVSRHSITCLNVSVLGYILADLLSLATPSILLKLCLILACPSVTLATMSQKSSLCGIKSNCTDLQWLLSSIWATSWCSNIFMHFGASVPKWQDMRAKSQVWGVLFSTESLSHCKCR